MSSCGVRKTRRTAASVGRIGLLHQRNLVPQDLDRAFAIGSIAVVLAEPTSSGVETDPAVRGSRREMWDPAMRGIGIWM